jgi:hypothetical protein
MTDTEKKIKAAKKKFDKFYESVPENQRDMAIDLINNIAFMQVQLEILREQILEHGMVSVYDNGKIQQDVVSPYCKAYSQIQPKYIQSINLLNKLLPSSCASVEPDELSEFTPVGL